MTNIREDIQQMAAPQTMIAQVQTDYVGSPSPNTSARPFSSTSSGRVSIASTSSVDGADSAFDGIENGRANRMFSKSSDNGGVGSRRSLLRERFSAGVSRMSNEGDDKLSRAATKQRPQKRNTRSSLHVIPKTNRGVWSSADFQYYMSKIAYETMEPSEWAMLGYKSARHYRPQRVTSTEEDELTSLQIFTVDDASLNKAYSMKDTLRRLDAHKCGIQDIPELLPTLLLRLERLDISCNSLNENSFPPSFNSLSSLIELNLNSNLLTTLPPVIMGLHKLQRLYLGFNDFSNMPSVEGLRHLTSLDLECNNLTSIPWQDIATSCKRLRVLNLQSNKISHIDKSIKLYRELIQIIISHNQLTSLPVELFSMKKLQHIDASHNQIIRLPQYNLSQQSQHMIELIDLSHNSIYKFSDWLLFVSWCIDLSSNNISTILGTVIKHMDYETTQRLVLRDNPLRSPPAEVCLAGLSAIIKHFQEIKVKCNVYQGVKVMVLGPKSSGKTSLVQSLSDGQSRLTLADEATIMCDISATDLISSTEDGERPFKLSMWDYSGDQFYLNTIHHFLDSNSLYLLTFNLATYRTGDFQKTFATWLNYIIAKNNEVKLLVVGTHADLLNAATIKRICSEVDNLIKQHFNTFKENIQSKIKAIESMENIGSYMQDQLKSYVNTLTSINTFIYGKQIAISSANYSGFTELEAAIKELASDTALFPLGLRQIPSLWVGVHDTVESLAKKMRVPVMHIDEFQAELIGNHGMKNMMKEICTYLHDTGTVVWLHSDEKLKDYVFLRPRWLIDVIKALVRSDLRHLEYEEMEDILISRAVLKYRGFHPTHSNSALLDDPDGYKHEPKYRWFIAMRDEVAGSGCFDAELVKLLLAKDVPSTSNKFGLLMQLLCTKFEYAYPIERDIGTADNDKPMFKLNTTFTFSSYTQNTSSKPNRPQSASAASTSEHASSIIPDIDLSSELITRTPKSSMKRPDSRASSTGQSSDLSSLPKDTPCLLTPCLRHASKPDNVDKEMAALRGKGFYHLTAIFVFPVYTPPGIFPRLLVRLSNPQLDLAFLAHWTNGIYAKHKTENISYTVQFWEEKIKWGDGEAMTKSHVRFEACKEEKIDFKAVQEMWGHFIPLLMDTENLIGQYKGLRIERYMECPQCNSPSFNGEWSAPKDMQQASLVTCTSCKKEVKTELLIQPRERKAEDTDRVFQELARRRTASALPLPLIIEQQQQEVSETKGKKPPTSRTRRRSSRKSLVLTT